MLCLQAEVQDSLRQAEAMIAVSGQAAQKPHRLAPMVARRH